MSDFQRGRREVVEGCTDIPGEKIKPGTTLAGGKQSHLSGTSRRDRPGVGERVKFEQCVFPSSIHKSLFKQTYKC